MEKYKQGKIRPTSYARYQFCLQLLCKDELAHTDIREIKLEHIQEYVNRLEAELSASTIKKQKLMLSQVLEHASSWIMVSALAFSSASCVAATIMAAAESQ